MQLIYISGSGRSGSTLVERLLHASSQAAGLGEFHCLWRMDAGDTTCSCGADAGSDPFWQAVRERAAIGPAELAELRKLENIVARSGFIARHGYSLANLAQDPMVQRFLGLQWQLFEAISALSGRPLLIDSSKAGPRAWIMACDSRVSFVHIYRAPTDVIASWRSRKFDQGLGSDMQRLSLGQAAMDWWKVEYLARRLARERAVQMVDYQSLCQTPRETIDGTLRALDLPLTAPAAWLDPHKVVPPLGYHSLNGNPDRFDRAAITISVRQTDWSRYDMLEAAAIKGVGAILSTIYPAPAQG